MAAGFAMSQPTKIDRMPQAIRDQIAAWRQAGIWTFGIRAHDIADQLSPDITAVNLTIINENPIIYDADEAVTSAPADGAPASPSAGWGGTRNGFVLHYTGVLIPENEFTPAHYGDYTDIDDFVHDPVASASYITGAIDTGYNDTLRVFNTSNYQLGPGQSGTPALSYAIDTWLTGASDPDSFTPWTIAQVTMRYLRAELVYAGIAAGSVAVITDFTPMIDKAPSVEQSNGAVGIASGGTHITFPAPFHFAPVVSATATSTGATSASAANVSATGFDLHVWSGSSDTGGTAAWSANGE